MSQLGQHLFEPGAVTTGFESDDYFTSECAIKPPHVVTLMAQLKPMDLAICQVTVTDGLLTSMKINCDIYCHRAPPLLITNPTVSVKQLTVGGACFITSDYADYTDFDFDF